MHFNVHQILAWHAAHVVRVSALEPETQPISMVLMIATAVIAVELEVVIPVASEADVVEDLALAVLVALEELAAVAALVVAEAEVAAVVEAVESASSKTSTLEELEMTMDVNVTVNAEKTLDQNNYTEAKRIACNIFADFFRI